MAAMMNFFTCLGLVSLGVLILVIQSEAAVPRSRHRNRTKRVEFGRELDASNSMSMRISTPIPLEQHTIDNILQHSHEANTCLTEIECDIQRLKLGFGRYYVGDYPTKGCFSKNGNAFWGEGGSVADKAKDDLGIYRKRIWCSGSTPDEDGGQDEEEDNTDDNVCLTRRACNNERKKMGLEEFFVGS